MEQKMTELEEFYMDVDHLIAHLLRNAIDSPMNEYEDSLRHDALIALRGGKNYA